MDTNQKPDTSRDVFSKEFQKLQYYREFLKNREVSDEAWVRLLESLLKDYELLLIDAVKITKIGDVSQHKLLKAKEKIEELNNKLTESERNVRELNTILMFYIKATDK